MRNSNRRWLRYRPAICNARHTLAKCGLHRFLFFLYHFVAMHVIDGIIVDVLVIGIVFLRLLKFSKKVFERLRGGLAHAGRNSFGVRHS